MTGLSASNFKLQNRGVIKPGNFADLVLFDGEKVKDNADFVNPIQKSAGIEQVYVNGVLAYQQGELLPQRSGRFLAAGEQAQAR